MNHAAKTIFPFGIYVFGLGLTFLIIPDVLLSAAGIRVPADAVSRIFGSILMYLGYYYVRAAHLGDSMQPFFKFTVHTRSTAIVFLAVFAALSWVNPLAIAFGAIDLAGAIWTWFGVKKDAGEQSARKEKEATI